MKAPNQALETLARVTLLVLCCSCVALLMLSRDLAPVVHGPSNTEELATTRQANQDRASMETELYYEQHSSPQARLVEFVPKLVLTEDEIEQLSRDRKLEQHFMQPNSMRLLHLNNVTYPIENFRTLTCKPSLTEPSDQETTKRKLQLIIVINSKWSNSKRRQRLRNSWLKTSRLIEQVCSRHGSIIGSFKYLFMVGKPTLVEGEEQLQQLEQEALHQGDIVKVNLVDNYRDLTMKHLSIFKWILGNHLQGNPSGQHADTLLLKCDDDAHIELGQLLHFYRMNAAATSPTNEGSEGSNWISCASFPEHTLSQRQPYGKWQLNRLEFPYDTFPAYCSGLAYLAPLSYVRRLLLLAHLVQAKRSVATAYSFDPPLWVDDVFVTGILGASLRPRAKIYQLNADFCYTKALRLHRKQLEAPCMVSEIDEARQ